MPRAASRCRPTVLTALISAAPSLFGNAAWSAIIFVDASNTNPTQDGASWATAFATLPPALLGATSGDEVWVAEGTYVPTADDDRAVSLFLPSGVALRGGFVAGAASADAADPANHPSILSGEIGAPGIADNSFRVLQLTSSSDSTLLDGFTITLGNADAPPNNSGAGLGIAGGAAVIRRCVFTANHTSGVGGGAFANTSSTQFVDCTFVDNHADVGGGADAQKGSPRFIRCRFHGNSASTGGAVRFLNAGLAANPAGLFGCVIDENSATSLGGGVGISSSHVEINGCTIVRNHGSTQRGTNFHGGGIHANSGTLTLRNTILTGNTSKGTLEQQQVGFQFSPIFVDSGNCIQGADGAAPLNGPGTFGGDPVFLDPDGPDDALGTFDDGFTLRALSPCIDAADGVQIPADVADLDDDGDTVEGQPIDFGGLARVIDDLANDQFATANSALDIGAHEFDRPGVVLCVDPNAFGGSGLTWKEAFTSLHTALGTASEFSSPVEIWIAEGVYPTTTGSDRTVSYFIPDDVLVFGGFGGFDVGERSRSQRDPEAHPTILSGEIGGSGLGDNAFHVVAAISPTVDSSLVDGVVITRGNADGGGVAGGGAETLGGGVLVTSGASLRVQNCRFIDNHAVAGGALALTKLSSATLCNCTATGNSADGKSGGAFHQAHLTTLNVVNCTVMGNVAADTGGGIAMDASDDTCTLNLHNSILFDNKAGDAEGMAHQLAVIGEPFVASLSHAIIQDFDETPGFTGINVSKQDPLVADLAGADGVEGTIDDDVALTDGSPAIDQGRNALVLDDAGDADDDLDVLEALPVDNLLLARFLDDAGVTDVPGGAGRGDGPVVDIGAIEYAFDTKEPAIVGDLNGDGFVNGADLGLLLSAWDSADDVADLNGDGVVNGADLGILLASWS
jgi:trimeric autotransporter adhesin